MRFWNFLFFFKQQSCKKYYLYGLFYGFYANHEAYQDTGMKE